MSTIDHIAAIRQEADRLYHMALIQEPDHDQLYRHADAITRDNEFLRREIVALKREVGELRCERRKLQDALKGFASSAREGFRYLREEFGIVLDGS